MYPYWGAEVNTIKAIPGLMEFCCKEENRNKRSVTVESDKDYDKDGTEEMWDI